MATESFSAKKSTQSVQKFGRFLSGMVMPNIGAFIAWGLITALFIGPGWLPNETLSQLVGPMLKALLPVLIGYTGGKAVGGQRGAVVGAVATFGVMLGAGGTENLANATPMFLGAMIVGPIGGWVIKHVDQGLKGKVPAGFEMLVNNFSDGIVGMILACVGLVAIGPIVEGATVAFGNGVKAIVEAGYLPLASIFIEPAKILFLNNAINHGVLTPLGTQQVAEIGKSIFFMLESNPGPGLGILLAYVVFAKGMAKQSAPGAIIIHFFGGIHEIYFPYILMNPILVLAAIAGGVSGVLTFSILGAGLVAPPAPGSIFMYFLMAPKGGLFSVLAGVIVSCAVSFVVASFFIKRSPEETGESELEAAKEKVQMLKGKKETPKQIDTNVGQMDIRKIVVACDAGMGSSAMGASILRKKLESKGVNIEVVNEAIDNIPRDAQIVVTHENLTPRAKQAAPQAEHISLKDFIQTPVYDLLLERFTGTNTTAKETTNMEDLPVLRIENVRLGLKSVNKTEAIKMAGRLLVESGYAGEDYIDAMIQRENDLTTYIGNGIAIPHGVSSAKMQIKKTGISILQFPEGVDFGEGVAHIVVGIAGVGNEHLTILSNLAEIMEDEAIAEEIKKTTDVEYVYQLFTKK
ncbi:MAG: PTS mannitol transporter subunit IICBA [Bacillota bacterium]